MLWSASVIIGLILTRYDLWFGLQVIVRDIVSKSVVAQFRAHKSPISALCFDPSGTLLVTASNQGHNINVFKIMPGNSGINSHVHLFQLQRGLTNAVSIFLHKNVFLSKTKSRNHF